MVLISKSTVVYLSPIEQQKQMLNEVADRASVLNRTSAV